ncbi:HlyD family secretion protein [Kistimonas scapharcae]|uniref:HlyD family secretion protein n=1 Tax=Kistimonas scapharcae TaxID=1036133 RepID=A0ABP8V2K7_9GAMM
MPFSLTAKKLFSVLVTLVVVAIAVYAIHWLFVYYTESPWTRDGRIRADVYQVAPDVTGRIVEMAVSDNQKVSKGDLLFAIDPASYDVALARAEADASSAKADLAEKRLEAERRRKLGPDMISKEERDKSELTLKAAEAQYRAAESVVNKARLDLARTRIYAPGNGYITNRTRTEGDFATAGQPVLSLVDSDSFYVYGYFLETKLPQVQIGAPARITLLSDDAVQLQGEVVSIARGITDYSTPGGDDAVGLLQVNPTFDWVRLAMRVPVRIHLTDIPPGLMLASGMTCTIVLE